MLVRDLSPANLGINDVDLEANVNTEYESGLINLIDRNTGPLRSVLLDFNSTLVGSSSAAVVQIYADIVTNDGGTLIYKLPLVTAIDVNAASASLIAAFGFGVDADLIGGGTIGTAAQLLMTASRCRFGVEITTAEGGTPTSNVADLRVLLINDRREQ